MTEAEISELGILNKKYPGPRESECEAIDEMGDAEDALRACPSLPKDLDRTILRVWAKKTYIIYSNKERRGVCTRCGHVLGARHFPLYSHITPAAQITKERLKAGLNAEDLYEMQCEDGEEIRAQGSAISDADMDLNELKTRNPEPWSKRITAHGTKYVCPRCKNDAILLESGRGRSRLADKLIITVPLVKLGRIYFLNLWTDITYGPFGRPDVRHYLKSLYVFGSEGNAYYSRSVECNNYPTPFCQNHLSKKSVHVPLASPGVYYASRRDVIALYSTGLDKKLKRTEIWKWARWEELFAYNDSGNKYRWRYANLLMKYLFCYARDPAIERLEQSGFTYLVQQHLFGIGDSRALNWRKNTLPKIFGLHMGEIRRIRSIEANLSTVYIYKKLRKLEGDKPRITIEQAAAIEDSQGYGGLNDAIEKIEVFGIPFLKVLTYQRRQFGRGRKKKKEWIRISDYLDYLRECRELNYDLAARDVAFPKNFSKAHQRTSELIQSRKDKKIAEENRKFAPKVKAQGIKIAKRKEPYEADGLLIRPAASIEEIAREGRLQHHCVASYWKGQAEGRYAIMLIRKSSKPDKPFFTLQLSSKGEVIQNRGKYNRDPEDEVIAFVDKWKKEVIDKPAQQKGSARVKAKTPAAERVVIAI